MPFHLRFADRAKYNLALLADDASKQKRYKAVLKALAYLESNPRHPSLNTHKFFGLSSALGEDVFEAYAENNTPAAYRIFWHYGVGKDVVTILDITPHP